tara:strand:+ start:496 stop:747 length:252 start_codon:yes stop_codon:yes gene_type:complete
MADNVDAGRYNEYDNVYDFIEFKVAKDVETLVHAGKEEAATKLLELLDMYLMHEINIFYKDGLPWYTINDAAISGTLITSEDD